MYSRYRYPLNYHNCVWLKRIIHLRMKCVHLINWAIEVEMIVIDTLSIDRVYWEEKRNSWQIICFIRFLIIVQHSAFFYVTQNGKVMVSI